MMNVGLMIAAAGVGLIAYEALWNAPPKVGTVMFVRSEDIVPSSPFKGVLIQITYGGRAEGGLWFGAVTGAKDPVTGLMVTVPFTIGTPVKFRPSGVVK